MFPDSNAEQQYAFIHFDIDRFRMINAFYGPREGDRLIEMVAEAIRVTMETYGKGTFGRIGGDVFGICMPYEKSTDINYVLGSIRREMRKRPVHYYLETCAGIQIPKTSPPILPKVPFP